MKGCLSCFNHLNEFEGDRMPSVQHISVDTLQLITLAHASSVSSLAHIPAALDFVDLTLHPLVAAGLFLVAIVVAASIAVLEVTTVNAPALLLLAHLETSLGHGHVLLALSTAILVDLRRTKHHNARVRHLLNG